MQRQIGRLGPDEEQMLNVFRTVKSCTFIMATIGTCVVIYLMRHKRLCREMGQRDTCQPILYTKVEHGVVVF